MLNDTNHFTSKDFRDTTPFAQPFSALCPLKDNI